MQDLYFISIISLLILIFFIIFREKILKLPSSLSGYLKAKRENIFIQNIFYFDKDLKLAILKVENEKYYILFNQNVINIIKIEKIKEK